MSAAIERPSRPKLSFPYWLALILFLGTVAEAVLAGGRFIVSPDYRGQRLLYGGITLAIALVLWLWVLGATRRYRKRDFAGPIQTVRGADSPFQPITALIFLSVAAVLAYSVTIPTLAHALAGQRTLSYEFTLQGPADPPRRGCARVQASQPDFGAATLCVPEDLLAAGAPLPETLTLTGRRSDFGFWPERYAMSTARAVSPTVPEPRQTVLKPKVPATR